MVNRRRKSNTFVHSLEKNRYNQKVISHIIDENNGEISNPPDILAAEKRFYESLYSSTLGEQNDSVEKKIFLIERKTLNDDTKSTLDTDIDISEIKEVIKHMKNDERPGIDRLSIEFYKIFWNEAKDMLSESYTFSIQTGMLSI